MMMMMIIFLLPITSFLDLHFSLPSRSLEESRILIDVPYYGSHAHSGGRWAIGEGFKLVITRSLPTAFAQMHYSLATPTCDVGAT